MAKGTVVLVIFPFTDLSGSKLRPSVILSDNGSDVTVGFVTTQIKWQEPTDLLLEPTAVNGLKTPSIVRVSKLATLDKKLIKGYIGHLSFDDLSRLNECLKQVFLLT